MPFPRSVAHAALQRHAQRGAIQVVECSASLVGRQEGKRASIKQTPIRSASLHAAASNVARDSSVCHAPKPLHLTMAWAGGFGSLAYEWTGPSGRGRRSRRRAAVCRVRCGSRTPVAPSLSACMLLLTLRPPLLPGPPVLDSASSKPACSGSLPSAHIRALLQRLRAHISHASSLNLLAPGTMCVFDCTALRLGF